MTTKCQRDIHNKSSLQEAPLSEYKHDMIVQLNRAK